MPRGRTHLLLVLFSGLSDPSGVDTPAARRARITPRGEETQKQVANQGLAAADFLP